MVRPVEGAASPAQSVQEAADGSVTVQAGETFAQVAQRNGVSESALREANPNIDPSRIQAGQELTLPDAQPKPGLQQPAFTPRPVNSDASTRIAEHALGGSLQAARLHSQIPAGTLKERSLEGKITSPDRGGADATGKPLDSTLQTAMTNAGMKNVANPPSEADLKTYYTNHAPAHEMIAKGNFKDAAAEYRKLAGAEKNPAEKTRLETVAKQLDVAQTMGDAKIGKVSFPPSEANAVAYFKTLKGKPMSDVQDAFRNYANAFYVHSETKGVDRGDITYGAHKHTQGKTVYNWNGPESWKEISDGREVHSDGRRVIDCEGYAYMGQQLLGAAGFKNIKFAVASRQDDPNTAENESFTRQHIMVSASRTVNVDGHPQTEVAVISNNHFRSLKSGSELKKQSEIEGLQAQAFVKGYESVFGVPGSFVTGDQAWRAAYDLEDAIKARQKK